LNRINLLLIIFIVTAFSGKNYAATKKESIAVFDFKLTNISPDTGNIVRNRIEYTLFKTRKFNLLERNRIDIIRKEKLIGGEGENSDAVFRAGKLLPADYVITGDITFKDKIFLNIVIVDTTSGTIVHSFSRNYKSETDLIDDADHVATLISEEILFTREFNSDNDDYILSSNFFLSLGSSYIPKAGKISEFAENGYTFTLHAGIRNVFLKSIRMGLLGAYSHIYTKGDINYISIAPFQYTISYEIQPYRKYFINTGLGLGTAQVTVNKNKNVMREFEACGHLFLELKYHIKSDLAFILYGNHYILFENDGNVDFSSIGGGFETLF